MIGPVPSDTKSQAPDAWSAFPTRRSRGSFGIAQAAWTRLLATSADCPCNPTTRPVSKYLCQ